MCVLLFLVFLGECMLIWSCVCGWVMCQGRGQGFIFWGIQKLLQSIGSPCSEPVFHAMDRGGLGVSAEQGNRNSGKQFRMERQNFLAVSIYKGTIEE
jgi:hypothetical protein